MPLYLLKMFGTFREGDDWPPLNDTTEMNMIDWVFSVEREGQTVKNISCLGEGSFEVMIKVTRTNP